MIINGDFEDQLAGWHVVSGLAFSGQPVPALNIGAQDVLIDGKPVVPLGGDFWHTPYPIGQNESFLIRSVGKPFGVLDSDMFEISLPYLAFRLGGSATGGAALELRVSSLTAQQTPGFPALDAPDQDGFVAIRLATPTGTDTLRESSWALDGGPGAKGLLGAKAKVRLRVNGPGPHRLLVDHIRLLPDPPPPFHPPLWGWADLHCHPMAQAGFGGLLAGHMHGPVEDLGSCLHEHGVEHGDPLRPLGILDGPRDNDGSLAAPGWTVGTPADEEQLGFRGWPAFDDLTHIKVHQDWMRRAYDGGQRLMVALIVHSELLSDLQLAPQSDRDTVEPQIQMLKEFVAHNHDWCGLAKTPLEARTLIEQNKLAFVLGLETDSINGWILERDFPKDPVAIHTQLHDYFGYLRGLGIVQVNLLHLSDNAFGGMALYDFHFMLNTWARTTQLPTTEPVVARPDPDDDINCRVTVRSWLWAQIEALANKIGLPTLPAAVPGPFPPPGDRNAIGLTPAGEVAVLEAMRLGMVIDLDHMSEKSAVQAHMIATTNGPTPYPLVSAHNGARRMAPRPSDPLVPWAPTMSESRRGEHLWPNENAKSNAQLAFIKETRGMFGHGTAGVDSRTWGTAVANDCPGTDKTFAQGYQYVRSQLNDILKPLEDIAVGLGTDWNSLLAGPGPRFGTRAASGLIGELEEGDSAWQTAVRMERLHDASIQTAGVKYSTKTPLTDWRTHRFPDTGLYKDDLHLKDGEGECMWQAMAVVDAGVALTLATVQPGPTGTLTLAAMGQRIDARVRDLALGMLKMPDLAPTDHQRAGTIFDTVTDPDLMLENLKVQSLVAGLKTIKGLWDAMRSGTNVPLDRSMAGPLRDFDYNLDGLAHYGMFPDMFQDLINVHFPRSEMAALFGSAEQYIEVWEASDSIGAGLPH